MSLYKVSYWPRAPLSWVRKQMYQHLLDTGQALQIDLLPCVRSVNADHTHTTLTLLLSELYRRTISDDCRSRDKRQPALSSIPRLSVFYGSTGRERAGMSDEDLSLYPPKPDSYSYIDAQWCHLLDWSYHSTSLYMHARLRLWNNTFWIDWELNKFFTKM